MEGRLLKVLSLTKLKFKMFKYILLFRECTMLIDA